MAAFQHNLYTFLRSFVSLQTLPFRASFHHSLTAPTMGESGLCKHRTFRISKCYLQPKIVNIFSCKYKHSSNYCNPVYKNVRMSSSYSPYAVHCSQLNSLLKSVPGFQKFVLKRYHESSKFTIKSPVYSSYLNSLTEEYENLTKIHPSNNNTELQQQQLLRINFLRPVVEVIKRIQMKDSEFQELSAASRGESDKEMKKMMEIEIEKCNEVIEEMEEELAAVLVGEDPADQSDTVLEVAAGVGGQEAMLFAADILNMYCNYAQFKGWTITGLTADQSEIGGTRKATIEISGQDVYKHMKYEAGVHRVQRVPKTEKAGRIHTSTVSVSVLPQAGKIDIDIQPHDLKIEACRASGPGGQSVNTTDSAVRITHLPTGTVSECKQERSQIKNKEIALKNLKNKMYQAIIEEQESKRKATRKMQMGTRSRSDKIRTYNFHQDRVTDHRLKESCSDLTVFMTGGEGLDSLLASLADQENVQSLGSMLNVYEAEVIRKSSEKS